MNAVINKRNLAKFLAVNANQIIEIREWKSVIWFHVQGYRPSMVSKAKFLYFINAVMNGIMLQGSYCSEESKAVNAYQKSWVGKYKMDFGFDVSPSKNYRNIADNHPARAFFPR